MKTCHDCPAEISNHAVRCPSCQAAHKREWERARGREVKAARRERLLSRPCRWAGCPNTLNTTAGSREYCDEHRRPAKLAYLRERNALRTLARAEKRAQHGPAYKYAGRTGTGQVSNDTTQPCGDETSPTSSPVVMGKRYFPRKPGDGPGVLMATEKNALSIEKRVEIIAQVDSLRAQGRHQEATALHCAWFATPYRENPKPARIGGYSKRE